MKENGFAIGLLVGTLVLGGGLVAFGVNQKARYSAALDDYDTLKSDVEGMASVEPYPNEENLKAREKEVTAFLGKVEGLQKAVQGYRPETLEKISPSELQNRLVAKVAAIKERYQSKGSGEISLPEQFAFGMEGYLGKLPHPDSPAKLDYQLKALEWMFTELAARDTYSIRNLVREPLPSETGADWKQPYLENNKDVPLAQSMPLELTFLADEKAANDFINTLVTSKEYFFMVEGIRIASENTSAPVRSQAGLEEEEAEEEDGESFGAFGDLDFEDNGDDSEAEIERDDAPVIEEGKILGQILGSEGVYVGLQLRLLLFDEPYDLPEIK